MSRPRARVNGNFICQWLMTGPEYATLRGWSQQTLRANRKKGPPFVRVNNVPYYSVQDIERHLIEKGYHFEPYDPKVDRDESDATTPYRPYIERLKQVLWK